jgi:short subunit dehydrogenase-like uncharacterized protein
VLWSVVVAGSVFVFGATGYTGRLIATEANRRGFPWVLCGRDSPRLAALADELDLPYRALSLEDGAQLRAALADAGVVLNAAGPFAETAPPLIAAALDVGAHYLDLTGEVDVVEAAAGWHAEAVRRQVMIMPAVGFDVVASDCLARRVADRLRRPRRLRLGIGGLRFVSRGSARTIVEQIGEGVAVRRNGAIVRIAPTSREHWFDFGQGPARSLAVSWADVASAYYSTGIPDIEVYFEGTLPLAASLWTNRFVGRGMARVVRPFLRRQVAYWPVGPTAADRASGSAVVVAEAEDEDGARAWARLRTPEVYAFSALSAVAAAERALRDDVDFGFQTPSRVWGADFVTGLPGVSLEVQ